MKRFSFLLTLAVAMLMVACGKSSKNEARFLDNLGIDVDQVQMLKDTIDVKIDTTLFHLNNEQGKALLGGIVPEWAEDTIDVEGVASIVAFKTLDNGVSIAFLWQEWGDGGSMYICSYDKDGKFADGMEFINWQALNQSSMEEESSFFLNWEERCGGNFTNDGFTIHRIYKGMRTDSEMTDFVPQWTIDKTYTYKVDDKGMMTLGDVQLTQVGKVPADVLTLDDLRDLAKIPASDKTVIDKLNQKAGAKEVIHADEDSKIFSEVENAIGTIFERNPLGMLQWMINHPGEQSSLNRFIEKADGFGVMDRERFDKAVEKLSDEAGRAYLRNLTKDWFKSERMTEDGFMDESYYDDAISDVVYDEEGNPV
ncbi:MAG: hypothetical protein IKT00_14630 [Prevotella sp.]|nr:hypothetical protein [Prevotella sp.]